MSEYTLNLVNLKIEDCDSYLLDTDWIYGLHVKKDKGEEGYWGGMRGVKAAPAYKFNMEVSMGSSRFKLAGMQITKVDPRGWTNFTVEDVYRIKGKAK